MEQSHFYLGALRNNTARVPPEFMGEQEVGAEREAGREEEEMAVAASPDTDTDTAEVYRAPERKGLQALSGWGTE